MKATCVPRLLLLALLLAPLAHGAEYHVAKTGSGSECTLEAPCLTIAAGLVVAGAGDTLWIHAGTYAEPIETDVSMIDGGSSWETRLTVAAWPGDIVVLRPASGDHVVNFAAASASYVELNGLDLDGAHVALQAVKIHYTADVANASHHIRLRDCQIHNAPSNGILVAGPFSTFNEFIGVNVHDNGGHGVYISTADNLLFDSDVWNHRTYGVHVFHSSKSGVDRNRILFNRTHGNGKAGVGAGILLASGTGNEARGNRSWNNDIGIYVFADSVDASVTGNWTWANTDKQILIDRRATGTIDSDNSTTRPEP
jgi:hypothetical protein